jgi:hypothetical protein
MASSLILVSVVAALMPLVQGSVATGMITEIHATSDCSGTVKKVDEDRENVCMEEDHDGATIYRKLTCTATNAVRTYYSDAACSTESTAKAAEQKPLACTADGGGGMYSKMTCGQAVNIGTMTQFTKAACPASNKTDVHHIAYTSGCRAKSEDEEENGSVTWTDASEIVTVEDGVLIIKRYATLDCTGAAGTPQTNYLCTGACAEMPGSSGTMWYTITDCLDDTGEALEGTAQTGTDGTISVVAKTADSSHRMSASGAGGLVALLAMLCLAQR